MSKPLVLERVFKASPERVWSALTDPDQMRQWYFDLDDFRPEVGFTFRFTGESDDCQYLHVCEVTEADPLKKLTYTWTYPDYPGLSYVTWELFPDAEGTLLVLTHSGLETFPDRKDFSRGSFSEGWTYFLHTALPDFLEK